MSEAELLAELDTMVEAEAELLPPTQPGRPLQGPHMVHSAVQADETEAVELTEQSDVWEPSFRRDAKGASEATASAPESTASVHGHERLRPGSSSTFSPATTGGKAFGTGSPAPASGHRTLRECVNATLKAICVVAWFTEGEIGLSDVEGGQGLCKNHLRSSNDSIRVKQLLILDPITRLKQWPNGSSGRTRRSSTRSQGAISFCLCLAKTRLVRMMANKTETSPAMLAAS